MRDRAGKFLIRVERWWTAFLTFLNRWWLWGFGAVGAVWLGALWRVTFDIASRAPGGTRGAIAQMSLIISASQVVLAFAVAMSTIYYARRTGDLVKLMEQQGRDAKRMEREDVAHALIGSAMEVAAHAGWLAEIQRYGLKWYRRFVPETQDAGEMRIDAWRQLSTALTHVSSAMERLRLAAPDLTEGASPIFDSAMQALRFASQGNTEGLLDASKAIRDAADALRDSLDDPSFSPGSVAVGATKPGKKEEVS